MTRLIDWFSVNVIYQVFAFAFSTAIGAAGLMQMLPRPWFVGLMLFSLALSFVAWWISARQAASSRIAQSDNLTARDLLSQIAEQTKKESIVDGVVDLRDLSSNDLRRKVGTIASELRAMENGHTIERYGEIADIRRPGAPGQAAADFNEIVRRSLESSNRRKHSFQSRLYAPALALRTEMRQRLGLAPATNPNEIDPALDFGMLAGPDPLHGAAASLENLARQLP